MSKYSKVKLVSESFVQPKCTVKQSKQPHYLAARDLLFLSTQYMRKGLLYSIPATSCFNITTFLEKLKHSLSLVLVYFYPLAGRFTTVKYEEEHACWVYVDCNKGPGARFIHATAPDVTVSDIISHSEEVLPIVWSSFDLGERPVVNFDGHTRALLSIQVTELVDGVFIGFSMSHSVADGACLWHFINTLSEVFSQLKSVRSNNGENMIITVSREPIFKPLFPDGYGPVLKLPYLEPDEFITRLDMDTRLRQRIFHFSAASVERLKAQANKECGEAKGTAIISSFQALSAFVWRSITKARNLPLESETTCTVVADSRARFNPPLSPVQFGNIGHLVKAASTVGELLENGLGWAAMLQHQAVAAIDDNVVRGLLKASTEKPIVIRPGKSASGAAMFGMSNTVVFGGSIKFDMYRPEFGLGRAVAVRTVNFGLMDGKITANPGREGGGSADLEVALMPHTMAALESDEEFMSFVS